MPQQESGLVTLVRAWGFALKMGADIDSAEKPKAKRDGLLTMSGQTFTVERSTNFTVAVMKNCKAHVPRSSSLMIVSAENCTITKERGAKVVITTQDDTTTVTEVETKIPVNCTSCAAPVSESGKCDYCGCFHREAAKTACQVQSLRMPFLLYLILPNPLRSSILTL